jgi:hypothetical protein
MRKLFFLHVPRCGGTSLAAAIGLARGLRRGEPGWSYMSGPARSRAAKLAGIDTDRLSEYLLLYFLSQGQARFVSGHFAFSDTAYRAFAAEWDFLLLLRHPVARWFSHYFFNRHKASDHSRIAEDLPTFLESERATRLGHLFITKLTGRYTNAVQSSPRDCVAAATAVLDKFTLVGCLERLDLFVKEFKAHYGLTLQVPRVRTNPLPPEEQELQVTDRIRARVEELCQWDIEVYNYALTRLCR